MKRQGIGLEDFCVRSASYQDVPRWLSVASASIFFIKPSFSKKSSCATKFGESLACGVPVVINSEIGDTDGIVKSDRIGVVIDKFALDSYKKGVDELLGLMKDGDNLRMRCRSRATASLSLNNGVNYYHMIYETLWKNKK